jgi:hypothetical protein
MTSFSNTKNPPQVASCDTRIRFQIRPVRQPYDGIYVSNWTYFTMPISLIDTGLGYCFLNCSMYSHMYSSKLPPNTPVLEENGFFRAIMLGSGLDNTTVKWCYKYR